MHNDEAGSAVIESVMAVVFILLLVLGTIQVAMSLYARNVVMSAVHNGARAATEVGGSEIEATAAAREAIARSSGSLVRNLQVVATSHVFQERYVVRITATGRLHAPGPVPVGIPVTFDASATREVLDVPEG